MFIVFNTDMLIHISRSVKGWGAGFQTEKTTDPKAQSRYKIDRLKESFKLKRKTI